MRTAATPSREPTTAPAISPPERPFRSSEASWPCASAPGVTIGVDVTVSVTLAPETVTTRMLVIGDGVADGMVELLGDVVGTGAGATYNVSEVLVVGSAVDEVVDVVVGET